jgi:hypothetical protein
VLRGSGTFEWGLE